MKAFLLAAGLGTRLRPITDTIPKCLVPIQGVPLLEWWLRLFQRHGITEVLINTHHLAESVERFVHEHSAAYGLAIHTVYEPLLLGSAGTIWQNRHFVEQETDFLISYADNLTNFNLSAALQQHRATHAEWTMALFHMDRPETRGIAQINAEGRVLDFQEKPSEPKGDLANGGIYWVNHNSLGLFEGAFDIGFDVIPKLVGRRIYGFESESYLRDVGTIESLNLGNEEWRGL